jgi:hypothetical protein
MLAPFEIPRSNVHRHGMKRERLKLEEKIAHDLPIPVTEWVKEGYASRTTIWRLQRAGMPVTRIGRRLFVKFSDLTNATTLS